MPQSDIVILDGGMSRELIRLGAPFEQPEWTARALLEAPHFVKQVHHEFAVAGADVLTTNSYALVPFHIGAERFKEHGEQLAALAGRLAREAADEEMARSGRRILVAGCLPPIFGSYEPSLYDGATVQEYLSVLVRGLAPYVDLWLGETLSLIAEGEAVRTAVRETGKPFWISFTLEDREEATFAECNQSPARLRSGELVTNAALWALKSDTKSLLFNCSRPEFMAPAIRDVKAVFVQHGSDIPLGVYANAFEPKSDSTAANEGISPTRADLTNKVYTDFAREWVGEGANIIGGCCGIGCEHIEQLAHGLKGDKGGGRHSL